LRYVWGPILTGISPIRRPAGGGELIPPPSRLGWLVSEEAGEGSIRSDAFGGEHAGKRRVDGSSSVVRMQGERPGIGVPVRAQDDLLDDLCAVLRCPDGIRWHRGIVHIALPGDVVEEIGAIASLLPDAEAVQSWCRVRPPTTLPG